MVTKTAVVLSLVLVLSAFANIFFLNSFFGDASGAEYKLGFQNGQAIGFADGNASDYFYSMDRWHRGQNLEFPSVSILQNLQKGSEKNRIASGLVLIDSPSNRLPTSILISNRSANAINRNKFA